MADDIGDEVRPGLIGGPLESQPRVLRPVSLLVRGWLAWLYTPDIGLSGQKNWIEGLFSESPEPPSERACILPLCPMLVEQVEENSNEECYPEVDEQSEDTDSDDQRVRL